MGNSYYYFVASLAMISFDQKSPMTVEEYLKLSREHLSDGDYLSMESILVGSLGGVEASNQTLEKWIVFEKSLKNEIAAFRAQRLRKNPDEYIVGNGFRDYSLQVAIDQASKKENLLEAEKDIDAIRWQFLEDLTVGHYFDVEALFIYGLKLKILERYQHIASSRGAEVFNIYKENAAILAGDDYGVEKKMLQKQDA